MPRFLTYFSYAFVFVALLQVQVARSFELDLEERAVCGPGFERDGRSCRPCRDSFVKPTPGDYRCRRCPPDEFADRRLQCRRCPFRSPVSRDRTTCLCPDGQRLLTQGRFPRCEDCPRDTFAPRRGTRTCEPCPRGTFSRPGSTSCFRPRCAAGTRRTSSGRCVPCGRGFTSTENSRFCTRCDGPREYSDQEVSPRCKTCPTNTFPNANHTACSVRCGPGSIRVGNGCRSCTGGREYTDVAGLTACKVCSGNTIANDAHTACVRDCPSGTRRDADTNSCVDCPAGTFGTGGDICIDCIGAHEYTSEAGQGECSLCPGDSFAHFTHTRCVLECYNGFRRDVANNRCVLCEAGTVGTGETEQCTPCTGNQVATEPGLGACEECPGSSVANADNTECTLRCPAGQYRAEPTDGECTACPAGTFSNIRGASACNQCAVGTYQNLTGQTQCKVCPAGTTTANTGARRLNQCRAIGTRRSLRGGSW